MMESQFLCVCGAVFKLSSSFSKHQRVDCAVLLGEQSYQCQDCGIKFSKERNLIRHQKNICKSKKHMEKRGYTCTFENCGTQFYKLTSLTDHVEYFHGVEINTEKLVFSNYDQFQKWKQKEEQLTFSYFSKRHSYGSQTATYNDPKLSYETFYCQFHGSDKPHHDTKGIKKNLKGRSKTGMICYAHIFSKVDVDGSVKIKYVSSHCHPLTPDNTKFQPLPQGLKDDIMRMYSVGFSASEIHKRVTQNKLSRENRDDPKPGRANFVQMHNIRYLIKLMTEKNLSTEAAEALDISNLIDSWCNEDYNPVLLYKPQNEVLCFGPKVAVPQEYFIFGYQTKEQALMMIKCSRNIIHMDFLYDTDGFGVQTLNLVVEDEIGQEYPVAHFIMSSTDENTLALCMTALRERLPKLSITSVITSDQTLCQVLKNVFNQKINSYLCHSFVLSQWHKKLEEKSHSKLVNEEVMSSLTKILNETSPVMFRILCNELCSKYLNLVPEFILFFKSYYLMEEQIPYWSTSCRQTNTKTCALIHAFHTELREKYLKKILGSNRTELIKLLIIIAEMEKDYYAARCNAVHPNVCLVPEKEFKGITTAGSNKWNVQLETEVTSCTVTRILSNCFDCNCVAQNSTGLCLHLYVCSCDDYNLLCRHIYKVHQLIVSLNTDFENLNKEATPEQVKETVNLIKELGSEICSHLSLPIDAEDCKRMSLTHIEHLQAGINKLKRQFEVFLENAPNNHSNKICALNRNINITQIGEVKKDSSDNSIEMPIENFQNQSGTQQSDHIYCIPQLSCAESELDIGCEIIVSQELECLPEL